MAILETGARRLRRRRYIARRRAYWPRLWPIGAIGAGANLALVYGLDLAWWGAAISGIVTGIVVAEGRLMIWRRRHPVITFNQYLDDKRKAARWN